jgi:hypothetical protein
VRFHAVIVELLAKKEEEWESCLMDCFGSLVQPADSIIYEANATAYSVYPR